MQKQNYINSFAYRQALKKRDSFCFNALTILCGWSGKEGKQFGQEELQRY